MKKLYDGNLLRIMHELEFILEDIEYKNDKKLLGEYVFLDNIRKTLLNKFPDIDKKLELDREKWV